ncbi:MAG TPA: YafY family protein [Niabella sp.]|nr:YafY family protein [Niabella sp.]HOZ96078.1 YafY family protein [Niabella sp.]HQW13444.1 YafY family protein [Niabella sp.]HQX18838.1 YafY family protein [Niabella sp.]HQX42468.1 YafY family protein [Niabella sp.]
MQSDTLKRFDRLVSILIQLQSKKIVKAQEIAERFQVSHRTIYRDIKTLENAGVPVFGEAGSGYSLVDGYRLPPVMFSKEEAASFLAADKLMQNFSDKGLGKHFESAVLKIRSVLRGSEKDWLANLETYISVHHRIAQSNTAVPNAMELLMESLATQRQIVLQYQAIKDDVAQERRIEPVGIFHENQYWYLLAYCHLRQDYRQFRLDRMHQIKPSDLPYTQKHPLTVAEYINQKQAPRNIKVRILIDRIIANYLQYDKHHYGFVSEQEKGTKKEMTFMIADNDGGFVRWIVMYADYAEIIEPIELKEKIKSILIKGLEQLEK